MDNPEWLKSMDFWEYDILSSKHCSVINELCDFLTMKIWFLQCIGNLCVFEPIKKLAVEAHLQNKYICLKVASRASYLEMICSPSTL